MMRRLQKGLTLIEILVVLAIISIISSMIFMPQDVDESTVVQLAAEKLRSTINGTRARAISTNRVHIIVFNVENYGDGRVMWNVNTDADPKEFPGRHWYAVIGPEKSNAEYLPEFEPPQAELARDYYRAGNGAPKYNVMSPAETRAWVESKQIGERHYLPTGARFLAMTDTDRGMFGQYQQRALEESKWPDEYPRPWYGVLKPTDLVRAGILTSDEEEAAYHLYPWGGYDLKYEQATPVAHKVQGDGKYARTGFNLRGSIDVDHDAPPTTWATGTMLDGYLQDAVLIFYPDGNVDFQSLSSRNYNAFGVSNQSSWDAAYPDENRRYSSRSWCGYTILTEPQGWYQGHGMTNDVDCTGGYHITICRDIQVGEEIYPIDGRYDLFNSEEDALRSMMPFRRIFVDRNTGACEVRNEEHRFSETRINQRTMGYVDQAAPYPPKAHDDKGRALRNRPVLRRPYRYTGYWWRVSDSLKADEWLDGEDGWKGWNPPYEK